MEKALGLKENSPKQQEVKRFFREVSFLVGIDNAARKRLNTRLAEEFNVFDYINPDENKLSDIIRDLLNPRGTHGQGTLFLELFLKHCNIPYNGCEKVSLARELRTTHIANSLRRIDICIHLNGEIAIAIENKPWADDQPDQILDYAKNLERQYKQFYIVYMPGASNRAPNVDPKHLKALDELGRYVSFPYNTHFKRWLVECRTRCDAEKVRIFLRDLISWVDRSFYE